MKSKKGKHAMRMRNPFYNHPLMGKGAVHEKPLKARRKVAKQKLVKEWCSLSQLLTAGLKNTTLLRVNRLRIHSNNMLPQIIALAAIPVFRPTAGARLSS